eukprot:12387785-Ditylum_brightwellii.AAC.1
MAEIKSSHNCSLYKWASALQYVSQRTRVHLGYGIMQTSGYMVAPNKPIFDTMHQLMVYLWYHPHKLIMYPHKSIDRIKHECHFGKGEADISNKYKAFFDTYNDADLAHDLCDQQSTTSIVLLVNGIATHWYCDKQPEPTGATSGSELVALCSGVICTSDARNFAISLGYPIGKPTKLYKDNAGTIKAITSNRITPFHFI